jgi:hypothetical protein
MPKPNGAITRNHPLIAFVQRLHDMHSDVLYGFNVNVRNEHEGLARCQRWLDAVLPEEALTSSQEVTERSYAGGSL